MIKEYIFGCEYADQANQLIDAIIPEVADSIVINVFTINKIPPSSESQYKLDEAWGEFDKFEIINSNKEVDCFMKKKTVMELVEKYLKKSDISELSNELSNYINTNSSGFWCRICSPIFLCDADVAYVMALFKLESFYNTMSEVYYDLIEEKREYIFVETLLRNILHNAQRKIMPIEYPQVIRDISTHSVDYILCRNLTLPHQDIFIYLSSLYYEGSSVSAKIIRDTALSKIKLIVELEVPLTLNYNNARIIRKLMEVSNYNCVLVLRGWDIVGIAKEECIQDIPLLSFEFLGHMHWKMCMSDKVIFRYKNGQYYLSNNQQSKTYFEKCIKKIFGIEDKDAYNLAQIVDIATQQKHGTSIVITDEAEREAKRLGDLNRGIMLKEFSLNENTDIIVDISSIDGAIIINPNCKCYGMGMILDGEAICQGDISRGSRYNSIANYIKIKKEKKKKYMAFIISEDGMIDVIS